MAMLNVAGLRKTFHLHGLGGKVIQALTDVRFSQPEGTILGLSGRSGSGKSTLMKCVYRTYLPTAGSIVYREGNGQVTDLAAAAEHEVLRLRRGEITYCSQFLSVIPRVPAVDVVAEPLLRRGVEMDEARSVVRGGFERLGLGRELWDAYPSTFSGGEQQRVNILRALVARPRLLLLDEPTASLDRETKDAVIGMILELKSAGTSMLLITHDAYTMDRLAGQRLHLENGMVEEPAYA
jgi:alpha-D-ribose 1-methylphosphonate 5-triphosphate synthase subunit PhnL